MPQAALSSFRACLLAEQMCPRAHGISYSIINPMINSGILDMIKGQTDFFQEIL